MMNEPTTWTARAVLLTAKIALLIAPATSAAPALPFLGAQEDKIVPDTLTEHDRFPRDIALTDDRIVMSNAHYEDTGLILVYDRTSEGPVLEATIESPFEDDGRLGSSIALYEDTLVAGVTGITVDDEFAAGAAVVFEEETPGEWTHVDTLISSTPEALSTFGTSVAIEGDLVAVGEPHATHDPEQYNSVGAFHVYEATTEGYEHAAEIRPPNDALERLGYTLEIVDETILAGAPNAGDGAVFVYEQATTGEHDWERVDTITPPESADASQFAWSMDLDEDTLVVGAPGPQVTACCWPFFLPPEGDAFAYEHAENGWEMTGTLAPSTATVGASVGHSVAIAGDTAFVGAPGVPVDLSMGTVTVFENAPMGWIETGILHTSDGSMGDRFGSGIGATEDTVIVGAPSHNEGAFNAGAAYVYQAVASNDEACAQAHGALACVQQDDEGISYAEIALEDTPLEASVVYEEEERLIGQEHTLDVRIEGDDASGSVTVTCLERDEPIPCRDVSTLGGIDAEQAPVENRAGASCNGIEAPLLACDSAWTQANLDLDDASVQASAACGFGFFTSCPLTASTGASAESPWFEQGTDAGYNTAPPSVTVCTHGDAHQACHQAP